MKNFQKLKINYLKVQIRKLFQKHNSMKLIHINFLILFIIFAVYNVHSRKLVLVQNLFRHGARYPIFLNDDDFTKQPRIANYAGQLTPEGKNMHYLLGKILYKKYWKALFTGTNAQNSVDPHLMYAKSTSVNRTIQSLQSQLRGWTENLTPLQLNPENLNYSLPAFQNISEYLDLNYTNQTWSIFNMLPKFQTFPFRTGQGDQDTPSSNPYDEGDFLLKYSQLNCPKQLVWQKQNYQSEIGKYIANLPEVKQAIQKLSQSFPSLTLNITNAYKVIDNYVCMQYLGQATLKIFSDPKYEKILRYIKEMSLYISLFLQPIQYRTTATNLFQNIVVNFQKAINQTGPKLILYSAHDTTVAMVLATFNITNINCINDKYLKDAANQDTCASDYPPFSSNFIIEVYKQDNGSHTFSLVFNNIQRKIPFCDYQYSCPVQKFYDWVNSWKVADPNNACGVAADAVKLPPTKEQKKQLVKLYVVISVLIMVIIILSIWMIAGCIKRHKQQKAKAGYMQNFEQKDHHPNKSTHEEVNHQDIQIHGEKFQIN